MKNLNCYTRILLSFLIIVLIPVEIHGFESQLKTIEANPQDISGIFTLIAYGGRYADDVETIALLDKEGDGYTLEPYAPDFDFMIKKGLLGEEAFQQSKKFVSFHPSFWYIKISKIIDVTGNTIGYEIKPLYLPFCFGFSDIIETSYWPKEKGKIKVIIKLKPEIERLKYHGGDGFTSGGGGD